MNLEDLYNRVIKLHEPVDKIAESRNGGLRPLTDLSSDILNLHNYTIEDINSQAKSNNENIYITLDNGSISNHDWIIDTNVNLVVNINENKLKKYVTKESVNKISKEITPEEIYLYFIITQDRIINLYYNDIITDDFEIKYIFYDHNLNFIKKGAGKYKNYLEFLNENNINSKTVIGPNYSAPVPIIRKGNSFYNVYMHHIDMNFEQMLFEFSFINYLYQFPSNIYKNKRISTSIPMQYAFNDDFNITSEMISVPLLYNNSSLMSEETNDVSLTVDNVVNNSECIYLKNLSNSFRDNVAVRVGGAQYMNINLADEKSIQNRVVNPYRGYFLEKNGYKIYLRNNYNNTNRYMLNHTSDFITTNGSVIAIMPDSDTIDLYMKVSKVKTIKLNTKSSAIYTIGFLNDYLIGIVFREGEVLIVNIHTSKVILRLFNSFAMNIIRFNNDICIIGNTLLNLNYIDSELFDESYKFIKFDNTKPPVGFRINNNGTIGIYLDTYNKSDGNKLMLIEKNILVSKADMLRI